MWRLCVNVITDINFIKRMSARDKSAELFCSVRQKQNNEQIYGGGRLERNDHRRGGMCQRLAGLDFNSS